MDSFASVAVQPRPWAKAACMVIVRHEVLGERQRGGMVNNRRCRF